MLVQASVCPKFPEHSAILLEKLNAQRYYGAFCDVIIRVEDCDFKLHKCVLAATSSKLQTLMYGVGGKLKNTIFSSSQCNIIQCTMTCRIFTMRFTLLLRAKPLKSAPQKSQYPMRQGQ